MSRSSLRVALEALRLQLSEDCASYGMALTSAALDTLDDLVVAQFSVKALKSIMEEADNSLRPRCLQLIVKIIVNKWRLTSLLVAIIEDRNIDEILAQYSAALDLHVPALPAPAAGDALSRPLQYVHLITSTTTSLENSNGASPDEMRLLKKELHALRFDLPGFFESLFQPPPGLREAAREAFIQFSNGPEPKYNLQSESWVGWPGDPNEPDVRQWLDVITSDVKGFLEKYNASSEPPLPLRQIFSENLSSSAVLLDETFNVSDLSIRKVDGAFVEASLTPAPTRWNQILVPIELNKSATADPSTAFYDLAKYVSKIFNNQSTRHFVLGLTLCSDLLRVWRIDPSGPLGSCIININKNPEQFLFVLLSLHCMSSEGLGFDSTIQSTEEGLPYIRVPGESARFLLLECILPPRGIVSRGTTAWKGRFEGSNDIQMVKWSWQPIGRDEGQLLAYVTSKGLENVGHSSHCWTVLDADDEVLDIDHSLRKGIDIRKGSCYVPHEPPEFSTANLPPTRSRNNTRSLKRSASEASLEEQPSKRTREEEPRLPVNRTLQRILLTTVGKPIHLAESPEMLLTYLIQCIEGHHQLFNVGILHRDISMNNLLINTDTTRPTRLAFLIDLDHAIRYNQPSSSSSQSRMGTRIFMSSQILLGRGNHFLEDDLESFFWVLYWICCHHDGPNNSRTVRSHPQWFNDSDEDLGGWKWSLLALPPLLSNCRKHMTEFYLPLFGCIQRFGEVLGQGARDRRNDVTMYRRVLDVLTDSLDELRRQPRSLE